MHEHFYNHEQSVVWSVPLWSTTPKAEDSTFVSGALLPNYLSPTTQGLLTPEERGECKEGAPREATSLVG